jgi:hypothetical protein
MAESSRFVTGLGIQQGRQEVSGDSKNIDFDFSTGNNFFVSLEKNCSFTASNLPGAGQSQTVTIVTEQPAAGFYSITWSQGFLWPKSQLGTRGGPNATLAPNSVDSFSFVSSPDLSQGEKLLGVAAANFY